MLWVWVKGNGPPLWSARSPALDCRVCYHFQINLRLPHGESLCVFICVTFHMWSVLSVMWQHIIHPLFKYWNALRRHTSVYVYCMSTGLHSSFSCRSLWISISEILCIFENKQQACGCEDKPAIIFSIIGFAKSEYQGTNKQTGTNQRMNSLKNCFILAYRIKASAAEWAWVCCNGYLKKSIRICKRTVQGLLNVL